MSMKISLHETLLKYKVDFQSVFTIGAGLAATKRDLRFYDFLSGNRPSCILATLFAHRLASCNLSWEALIWIAINNSQIYTRVNIFCIFTSSKDTLFRAISVSSTMKKTLQVLFTGNLHKKHIERNNSIQCLLLSRKTGIAHHFSAEQETR